MADSEKQRLIAAQRDETGKEFNPVDREAGKRRCRQVVLGIAIACCLAVGISLAIALPLSQRNKSEQGGGSSEGDFRELSGVENEMMWTNPDRQQQSLLNDRTERTSVAHQAGTNNEPDLTFEEDDSSFFRVFPRWWTTTKTVSTTSDTKPLSKTTTTWQPLLRAAFSAKSPSSNDATGITTTTEPLSKTTTAWYLWWWDVFTKAANTNDATGSTTRPASESENL